MDNLFFPQNSIFSNPLTISLYYHTDDHESLEFQGYIFEKERFQYTTDNRKASLIQFNNKYNAHSLVLNLRNRFSLDTKQDFVLDLKAPYEELFNNPGVKDGWKYQEITANNDERMILERLIVSGEHITSVNSIRISNMLK